MTRPTPDERAKALVQATEPDKDKLARAFERAGFKVKRIPHKGKTESQMPKNTKVKRAFNALRRKGASPAKAARIAQAATGKSLKTGRKPKGKK